MKKIKLTRGLYAIVDDKDYSLLSKYKWHATGGTNTNYACRQKYSKSTGKVNHYMHREILGMKPYKYDDTKSEVDHINKNGLDNRKCNIKVCTKSENAMNRDNGKLADIVCQKCNKTFHPTNSKIKFCSSICFGKYNHTNRTRNVDGTFSARKLGML